MVISRELRKYLFLMKQEIIGNFTNKLQIFRSEMNRKFENCHCYMLDSVREECKIFCDSQSSTIKSIEQSMQAYSDVIDELSAKPEKDSNNHLTSMKARIIPLPKERIKSIESQISENHATNIDVTDILRQCTKQNEKKIQHLTEVIEGTSRKYGF